MRQPTRPLAALALALLLALSGCGSAASSGDGGGSAQSVASSAGAQALPEADSALPDTAPAKAPVDLDLTTLSSTMVFAEVSNLIYDPLAYLGQTVRMQGAFSVEHGYTDSGDEDPSRTYYYCIIEDALACCAQGLEFTLAEPPASPEGWPAEGDEVTVVGTVELYEEDGFRYLRLAEAELEG